VADLPRAVGRGWAQDAPDDVYAAYDSRQATNAKSHERWPAVVGTDGARPSPGALELPRNGWRHFATALECFAAAAERF
jgi:hypothetical protein